MNGDEDKVQSISKHIKDTVILQYIPRNMHTVFALLCFVVVLHWLIFPYPSGILHWHCGNLTIAPVPAKQPWWIWINTSCEFIMNDWLTTTKQSTTKPCAYFLGYTLAFRCDTNSISDLNRSISPRYILWSMDCYMLQTCLHGVWKIYPIDKTHFGGCNLHLHHTAGCYLHSVTLNGVICIHFIL